MVAMLGTSSPVATLWQAAPGSGKAPRITQIHLANKVIERGDEVGCIQGDVLCHVSHREDLE